MCRSDTHHFGLHRPDPHRLLTSNAFYLNLKLSAFAFNNISPLSDSLTLLYLPRINGYPLEINGSKIRPDLPAYVTLHRVVNAGVAGSVVFGSMEKTRVGEGVRFEVYIGDEKLLKGVYRRDKAKGWRVDCTCVLEREIDGLSMAEAEVCVVVDGGRMSERVAVVEKRRRRRRVGFDGLEEIPEEAEEEEEGAWDEGSCEGCSESESDGGEDREEDLTAVEEAEMEYEMEGVRWAVDVGIWVVCLGVGYLVSRASAKTFRRRKILF